ncbi:MAG: 30S ribosomal protein S6 [Candidatus Colwellbacteria bacterium]|nr:30S ribosomal protein S6 [Candidatus Colwellbacteria bacterium]
MMEDKLRREYEISFLLRQEEDLEVIPKVLLELGANIVTKNAVSEIRLAYPIGKETRAYFGYIHFDAEPSALPNFNESLRLNKKIIRFIVITPPFVKVPSRRFEQSERFRPESQIQPELSNDALHEKLEEIKI